VDPVGSHAVALVPDAQMLRTPAAVRATPALAECLHCGQPVLGSEEGEAFCCGGCRTVYGLLRDRGLARYYDLRGDRGLPVGELNPAGRDRKWLEPLEQQVAQAGAASCRLDVDVQGIHCAACVWLLKELFAREDDGLRIVVNPAVGRATLDVRAGFALDRFVGQVEQLGYRLGPPLKAERQGTDELLLRTGICIALAMNGMMFAAAIHLGLSEGPVHAMMAQLGWGAALLSVLIGGPVFFRSAWQGLRRGLFHLDLPIAVGIALAFAGSTWSFFFGGGRAAYVDSVAAFVALMLLGRWLTERVLANNRNRLLSSDGAEGLLTRRVRDGLVGLTPATDVAEGDVLLIAPGDLVPVRAAVQDDHASCSLDWINGESEPREMARGEAIPAGAFNAGASALHVRALEPFSGSTLTDLLRRPAPERLDGPRATPWWRRVSTGYVVGVLVAALGALLGWVIATGDAVRSFEVTTAVLVVTCPCAFGIAVPLAHEMAQARLRRRGLFVRSASLLDRLRDVRRVVFDKTGTLTDGLLHVDDPAPLQGLDADARAVVHAMVVRSAHPKSAAVLRALERLGERPRHRTDLTVTEHPGQGLEAVVDGRRHRLGGPAFAGADAVEATDGEPADLVYSVDGQVRARLATREALRPDAHAEVARLRRAGYDLWLLSGDAPERVRRMAARLGLCPDRGVGARDPEGKARWLATHDPERTLFVGDGINDVAAVDAASCAGTPAVDRPFMAARCDFYFVTPGLAPVAQALRTASDLAQVVRRNLAFAIVYNVVAVSLALAGFMQPWLAAVLMPLSSLTSLGITAAAFSEGRRPWRS
jgi:P-type Cu2+ transporter